MPGRGGFSPVEWEMGWFCLQDRTITDFWKAVFIICKTVHRRQWGLGTELPVNEIFVFLLSIHISKVLVAFKTHFTHFFYVMA